MIADLVWRTPVEGELPVPESGLALIAEHDGRPDTYGLELDLTLDGKTHRATADYLADEIKGNEPSVALEFTPALPRME